MHRYLLYASLMVVAALGVLVLFTKKDTYPGDAVTLSNGKALFVTHCLSCHGLAEEGFGPPLGGITRVLSEKQLTAFIRDPEQAIASGNERAKALQARYKQTMPSYHWMDDQAIHAILSYIDHQTKHYQIAALNVRDERPSAQALTGALVPPVKKSALKIVLEDYIKIPRLPYSTPDLGIAFLRPHPSGDGRLFASDQGGILYEIDNGKASIFLDIRSHISNFSIGPGLATGLGSFDFHPDFTSNGLIYITHAEKFEGQRADYRISDSLMAEVQWVLSEWKVDDVNAHVFKGTRRELLRLHAPTFGHGAQEIAFIPGLPKGDPRYGLLYFGFGDGGSNNIRQPALGHHVRSFLGTIMRIDPRGNNSRNGKYGIPPHNPFADSPDPAALKEIWAYGFRNPHRFAWDAANDYRMMVTDIGEANIEEINIVEKGGDYGWPDREGKFGIATIKDLKTVFTLSPADLNFYKNPFAQYDHTDGFAISGGSVYDGNIAVLRNKYVFGDIVNGKLFYVNTDPGLSDSSVYEIAIVHKGSDTDLRRISRIQRLHLRIAYDHYSKQLYVITKADGVIRRVSAAY